MESKQTVLGIAALFARIRWQSHNDAAARDYARLRSVFKCMTFTPLLRLLVTNASSQQQTVFNSSLRPDYRPLVAAFPLFNPPFNYANFA